MKPRVVLDTNMLLVPFQFGVDVLEEIQRVLPGAEVYVLRASLNELENIARRGRKMGKIAALARRYMEQGGVKVIEREGPVDRALVELAREGYVVATNDKELKRKVWAVGGRVLALRERNRLELF